MYDRRGLRVLVSDHRDPLDEGLQRPRVLVPPSPVGVKYRGKRTFLIKYSVRSAKLFVLGMQRNANGSCVSESGSKQYWVWKSLKRWKRPMKSSCSVAHCVTSQDECQARESDEEANDPH